MGSMAGVAGAGVAGAGVAGAGGGGAVSAATSMFVSIGLGVGGVLIAAVLVLLLAYLNVLDGYMPDRPEVRPLLIGAIVPLALAFAGIVALQSLQVVG